MNYPEVRTGDENALSDVLSGAYEQHYQIGSNDVVLDLGAHVGNFTVHVAPRCKKVIAIEPEPYNFELLLKNTAHLFNVLCVGGAALDRNGRVQLHINKGNSGGHGIYQNPQHDHTVEVRAIDIGQWLRGEGYSPNFAKIDTEGAELAILKSFKSAGLKMPMAIEMHSAELFVYCKGLLEGQGYSLTPDAPTVGVCYARP